MNKDLTAVATLLAGALLNLTHLSCQYEIQDVFPLCSGDVDPVVTLGIREKSASLLHLNFKPSTLAKTFLRCNITIRPPEGHSVVVFVQQTNFRKRDNCLDYIKMYGKDTEIEPVTVCGTVNMGEKTVNQPRAVFSDEVRVRIQVANSSILNQSQGNVSFILAATAYKTGTTCDFSSEFACPDDKRPGCMWKGLMCDGLINCPQEGTDEYSFSCRERRMDVLISYPAAENRNVSGNLDNTEQNENTKPQNIGKLTIEDFFALCIMGFLIVTTLIFIARIFAECFRSCFGLKEPVAQSSQTGAAICEAGEATPPQREISRPPSYETCMKDLDSTRPPSYSKCLFRLQELEVSQLSQAVYMASQPVQAACATTKSLESSQPCPSLASVSAATEERPPLYESLLSTPSISHSGIWMTNSSQGYFNPALLDD